MDLEQMIHALTKQADAVKAVAAEQKVPERVAGLYAIFVDDPQSLPKAFREHLQAASSNLLYVGKAGDDLLKRLVSQDLRHKNASSFFRSLGSMLGYTPVAGSLDGKRNKNNYRFSDEDTKKIIAWINEHLVVRTITNVGDLEKTEKAVIGRLKPLLNLRDNPAALDYLKNLREMCRRIARGDKL